MKNKNRYRYRKRKYWKERFEYNHKRIRKTKKIYHINLEIKDKKDKKNVYSEFLINLKKKKKLYSKNIIRIKTNLKKKKT